MTQQLSTENMATLEAPDSRETSSDTILTQEQRKVLYRRSLKSHQATAGLRLKTFVLGKRKHLRLLDLIPRRKRSEDVDIMCRYKNCDQYGKYNAFGMYEDKRAEGDYAYALPTIDAHVEQAFIQLLKIRPAYEVEADDKNDATMGLVAQMCQDIGIKELDRVMDKVTHSELYNILLGGESARFIGWQPNKLSPKIVRKPKYEAKVINLPARRECAQCRSTVGDAATCPTCDSADINEIPGGQAINQRLIGHDEIELGENTVHIPHMLALQRDMSAVEPEDTTFVIEYSYIDKHIAEWEFQSPIEPTHEGLPIEMQLRFDLERGSNQTDSLIGSARLLAQPGREAAFGANQSGAWMGRKQPLERHYWDPSQYGQFLCTVDETLTNGKVIPAGTLLGDYFPKGVRVIICGDTIMDMDHYVWRRKMTLVQYGRIAGSNRGAGMIKLVPLQDALNDNFNLSQTVKHTVGHPLTIINGRFVSELPGAGNVLKVTNAGVTDIGTVVKQFPGQSMSQADGADQIIQGAMQFIARTNTIGAGGATGAPDMRAASTAHGVAAMQEQQASGQSGPAGQRISADREMIVQLLENIQEFSAPEQKEELRKRFGRDVADAFFNCNLRQSMTVGIQTGTDMPRSMALTQANFVAFGNILGQIAPVLDAGGPMTPYMKEFLDGMATAMGFPLSMGTGRRDRREAEYRLNLLNDIERQMQQEQPTLLNDPIAFGQAMHQKLASMCTPMIATDDSLQPGQVPPDIDAPRVLMQDHDSFMDVYADWLMGEQAKSASAARKLVVIQLWLDHTKAQMSQKMVEANLQGEVEAAIAPPEPPQQSGPTPEQMAAATQQQAANDANMAAAKHDSDQQAADAQLQRDQALEQTKADLKSKLKQEELAAQPSGAAKVIETMAYKDVQPDIQDQIAAQAGFIPSQEHEQSDAESQAAEHDAKAGHAVLQHHLDEKAADADVARQIKIEKAKPAKPAPSKK